MSYTPDTCSSSGSDGQGYHHSSQVRFRDTSRRPAKSIDEALHNLGYGNNFLVDKKHMTGYTGCVREGEDIVHRRTYMPVQGYGGWYNGKKTHPSVGRAESFKQQFEEAVSPIRRLPEPQRLSPQKYMTGYTGCIHNNDGDDQEQYEKEHKRLTPALGYSGWYRGKEGDNVGRVNIHHGSLADVEYQGYEIEEDYNDEEDRRAQQNSDRSYERGGSVNGMGNISRPSSLVI